MKSNNSLGDFYDDFPRIEEAFQQFLDESLRPRGPDMLYDIVGKLGLPTRASVVDLGCGEGRHSIRLASDFGFAVTGVDPVERHIELANEAVVRTAEGDPPLRERVRFALGAAEEIPVEDASVDLIWCREVMMHVRDLEKAFRECRRILRDGGRMLLHQMFFTDRMEPKEMEWLRGGQSMVLDSWRTGPMEAAIASAGLEVESVEEFGGEWGEYAAEATGGPGRRLAHASRLLRDPERYIAKFGRTNYDIMLGDCLWHVYRMIGKLSGRVYLLGKAI